MRRSLGLLAAATALATIGTPLSTAQAVTASGTGAARVGTAQENLVVRLVNARRAKKKGCRALRHHPQLHRAARGHSADMAEQGYFSYTSRDGRTFTDRIREAGFTGAHPPSLHRRNHFFAIYGVTGNPHGPDGVVLVTCVWLFFNSLETQLAVHFFIVDCLGSHLFILGCRLLVTWGSRGCTIF
ncbi:hypothetical protein GCM10020220_041300 [Nonomuraea rubra]|uniref:CAP domain-containing protein n=1 Tax=Nonomuraea rubra TaxID=46180 RepID=UPI0031EB364B